MARKRKNADGGSVQPPGGISASEGDIRQAVAEFDEHRSTVDEASEAAKSALEPLVERGIPKKAAKVALGLRKLDAGKRADWFRGFGAMVEALGLNDQLELPLGSPGEVSATLQ